MITLKRYGAKYNMLVLYLEGLSTDDKPIDYFDGKKVENGSEYREVDTGKVFAFDIENTEWNEVSSGGGGGGGSSSGLEVKISDDTMLEFYKE